MRIFFAFFCCFCIFFSCTKDTPQTPFIIEGDYWDTVSHYNGPGSVLNISDTIVLKRVYKLNDSIYWLRQNLCYDTATSCTIGWLNPAAGEVYFKITPTNAIEITYMPGTIPIIFFNNPISGGYVNPADNYLNITRCYNYPSPFARIEKHRLKKI